MGWRYLLYTLCSITVLESPKFLVYRGRDEKAVQVLQNVARMNKTTCGLTLEKLEALESGWDSMNMAGNALNKSLRYTYRSYIYIHLSGTVGVPLGTLLYRTPHVGRKYTMVLSSALMAISIFIFSTINTAASNVGLNLMEYFFQSMFNAVPYGWTPEVFPAPIRGTACESRAFGGGCSAFVLYLAGGVTLGCVVTTAFLPGTVLGRQSL
ncbi:hypothetical protein BU26DRAFT_540639 [Trematosphaeria pertusa]|uniref:Major facilitator superfamily (MFS) profile domain-containing protein n=1 Tax=Trematosphaeria pertusa TaxID=390896 RepID=A0A6A6IGQ3_9PLEO|nr:uncharacterized protein BU26DRAFT_540639 [Trematosphaeria pertusa]KAF2249357.1 hypothetical protein BU26DRAFT_540639 [Trematosphaeria pertusa]